MRNKYRDRLKSKEHKLLENIANVKLYNKEEYVKMGNAMARIKKQESPIIQLTRFEIQVFSPKKSLNRNT